MFNFSSIFRSISTFSTELGDNFDQWSNLCRSKVEIIEKPPTARKKRDTFVSLTASLDELNFHTVWIFYEEELHMWVW